MCLTKLIEEGELPFKGIKCAWNGRFSPTAARSAGLLPGDYTADGNFRQALKSTEAIPRAVDLILNTFAELEGPILSHIRSKVDNLYAIGPLQIHLRTKVQQEDKEWANLSNSLWEEDMSCFKWLDSQPPKSVIYISFGSLVNLSNEEFLEFWHGILNSGHRFLWVIRPGSVQGQRPDHDDLLKELNESVNEMGLIVGWVPQEEVLAHLSVGGFLTHSGWNSTLESMISGLPMICWPLFVDQQVTSRFVSEVWKLGIDMKDTCDRFVIRKNIRDLMARNGDYGNESPRKWSEWSRQSVAEIGGSSCLDFNRLVEDIKRLSMK